MQSCGQWAEVATLWLGVHREVCVCSISLAPAQHPFSLQPPNHMGGFLGKLGGGKLWGSELLCSGQVGSAE